MYYFKYYFVTLLLCRKKRTEMHLTLMFFVRHTRNQTGHYERARLISEGFEKNVADHMLEDDILVTEELTSEKKNQMYLKVMQ